jgi:hypothetical protein
LLHTIKLLDWLGKLTWNRPQQLLPQPSHIWRTWSRKNFSAISRVVSLKFLCHAPELQKNSLPLAAQIHRP